MSDSGEMTGTRGDVPSGTGLFSAVVHERYGDPGEVLSLAKLSEESLKPGPGDAIIGVTKRAIHPGDVHIVRGLPSGGPSSIIPPERPRVPGFEGVGIVERLGSRIASDHELEVGQRVAFFFPGARAWASKVVAPAKSVVPLPDDVPDELGALMLINTVTALVALRAARKVLPLDTKQPVAFLQSGAGSAVGLLVSRLAIEDGMTPIRLVRSRSSADALDRKLPGAPVIATDDQDWDRQVKDAKAGRPLQIAIDSVGGAFLDDIAALMDSGGTIINYGWLGSGTPNLSGYAPRHLTFSGVAIGSWLRATPPEVRKADVETAIRLVREYPELFEVAAEYPLEKFQQGIEHAFRSGKVGTVLLVG